MSVPSAAPPSRPLLPVLGRMALGLLLLAGGSLIAWQGVSFSPTPGLGTVTTPLAVPLDGPLPLDMAASATLRFEGDRGDLHLLALPARSGDVLWGQATHRARNPVNLRVDRQGHTLDATIRLNVQPLDQDGVVVTSPRPLQHRLQASLTPRIPLTLVARTAGGDQTLDLRPLRVRALSARSLGGHLNVTLPARAAGPLALVTSGGHIRVVAPGGAGPEALRANTVRGHMALDLRGAQLEALSVGSGSGQVRLTLPRHSARASVTTASGDIIVTARPGTIGNLDLRTQTGDVTLRVPRTLALRVRFTDRETLLRLPGLPQPVAPQLDVFVDAPSQNFTLEETP
ncbi:hypothetical protein DEDE109153_07725 [Deinococcus deserti]|uniref:Adhesin domain-containing protein n=1 Tax=Deinococcus deserti (strain DSM 17065 / CIP 109153 / LMG 22923 / VCD115) TaxID=546414 RepID=C1CWD3_DEIDV|nr:hypothetical protein [Deinococcus deserti]ACO46500.1 hypothetical protein Deide_15380 [Deinococcus deserti VCD115]